MNTSTITNTPRAATGAKAGQTWIYSGLLDFFLLHGSAGLLVLPLALCAFLATSSWYPLLITYGLCLGMPHLMATHLRLNVDKDCRKRFGWLAHIAPLVIIASIFALVSKETLVIPYLVFTWFVAQTFHANAQNFGIMRRYVKMAGADKDKDLASKSAEVVIQLSPWAFVLTCLLNPATSYLGYKIQLPSNEIILPLCLIVWAVTLPALAIHIGLEVKAMIEKRAVPGRILCVWSALFVNALAWLVVREIHWGYLIVSTWHALQYIAYVHAFRQKPPPNLKPEPQKLSLIKHLALLYGAATLLTFVLWQISPILPMLVLSVHIGMNFHHYLSDMLIWRKPPPSPKLV